MKQFVLIILSFISIICYSQGQLDYSKEFASQALEREFLIKDISFDRLVQNADLSDSWNMTKDLAGKDRQNWNIYSHQGIFGENYYRIDFFINNVSKSDSNPLLYNIKGKTRLKGNICDFKGEIVIKDIRRFKNTGNSVMHSHEFSDTVFMGVIVADYKFYEDINQHGSGVLEGKFASGVFIYPNYLKYSGIGSWDEIDETDMLGTFVGTWKSYNTALIKKCIFSYYTNNYPFSGDFHEITNIEKEARNKELKTIETPLSADQLFGKGINSKYINNGWNINPNNYNKDWWK